MCITPVRGGRVNLTPTNNIPSLTCVPSGKLITQSFGTLVADRSWKLFTRVYLLTLVTNIVDYFWVKNMYII